MGYALEYHLYHKGYGPTNVTLRDYLREHFSEATTPKVGSAASGSAASNTMIEHRADTLFGGRLEDDVAD
jgi:hypothetical protein